MTGRVTVVGLGPGQPEWCTPAVKQRLTQATDIVGYRRYLELVDRVAPEPVTASRHGSGNRVEAERARTALDLAAAGGEVVVVSSGDPGVFGMAAAVIEQLDEHPNRWPGVRVDVEPGVTAACALAGRVGAPLGHDFCVISLSDVLKPWAVIEQRLHAAAAAGFVVALYNPRSRHRPHQFAEALDVLGRYRASTTPVVVGRNVGRPGEQVTVTTLGAVDPDAVDMSTVVIVGSDQTRVVQRDDHSYVYTPRRHATPSPTGPRGVWLLTGGARAGKSAYAERLAARSGRPVTVVATAEAIDDEMAARIAAHRAQRPAEWSTIEAPVELADAIGTSDPEACLVVDCLTVWIGNLMHQGWEPAAIEAAAHELTDALGRRTGPAVVVTNEVGFGLVPETPLGRAYRDTLGRVNAAVAEVAERVILVCAGQGLVLSPLDRIG